MLSLCLFLTKSMMYNLFVFLQDALRLYLINSPVVRAEPLRFKREGVYGVVSIFDFCSISVYLF